MQGTLRVKVCPRSSDTSMQGSLLRPDFSKELQHETRLAPGWQSSDEYQMIESSPLPRVFPNSIQLDINSPESRESRESCGKPEYHEKPEHSVKADCDEKVYMRPHTPICVCILLEFTHTH